MKTVKEVSIITGVSVRTLHHYDAMGLLKPTQVTQAGYRLYDDTALAKLHTILLLRQLQFPLKEIKEILDTPGFDPIAALSQQIELLELQRQQMQSARLEAERLRRETENIKRQSEEYSAQLQKEKETDMESARREA